MPRYGSIAQVKKMLRPAETAVFGTDVDDRLTALQGVVSATIEEETGRSFGVPGAAVTDVTWAGEAPVLILKRPMRSVSAVQWGVLTDGSGGAEVDDATWVADPYDLDHEVIYGLRKVDGLPWGSRDPYGNPSVAVAVTGQLAGIDADTQVPAEIDYVANYLIAELFKRENASPAGFTGPDGTVSPLRDPYKEPHVVRIFDRYRAERRHLAV